MLNASTSFDDLFVSDYFGARWVKPGQTKVVTWSTTNGTLDLPGVSDATAVGDATRYLDLFQNAFNLWDEALGSIEFRYTNEGNDADITLAITDLGGRGGTWGFWNAAWSKGIFRDATIQFDAADIDNGGIMTVALHEIANVLGLGDMLPRDDIRSITEDPIYEMFQGDRLWDDDITLIRLLYGEDLDAPLGRNVQGTGAGDWLSGGTGNDTVDGGGGHDTLYLSGALDGYQVALHDDGRIRISDRGRDETGFDTARSVEELSFGEGNGDFSDGNVNLSLFTGITALSEAQITKFVEMYIAYFDRAPDATGLAYWGTRLAEGMTLDAIAESFFVQKEARAFYPEGLDNADLVRAAYNNFLERDPDPGGLAYWTAELDAGYSKGKFMLALINGARANDSAESRADVATIDAKADIGLHYSAIHGLLDVEDARTVMQTFERGDTGSLVEAFHLTNRYAAEAEASQDSFTLPLVGVIDDPSLAIL